MKRMKTASKNFIWSPAENDIGYAKVSDHRKFPVPMIDEISKYIRRNGASKITNIAVEWNICTTLNKINMNIEKVPRISLSMKWSSEYEICV